MVREFGAQSARGRIVSRRNRHLGHDQDIIDGRELFEAPGIWEVPDRRPVLLADRALELVAGIPSEANLRSSAREWIAKRYTTDATVAALLSALEAVSSRPGSASRARHILA